jgi:hypothetical protein
MGEERKLHKVLVGKPEGQRPLGRPTRGWEDGNRIGLRETGWDDAEFNWLRIGSSGGLL